MRVNRRQWVMIVVAVMFATVAVIYFTWKREPVYGGKKLSELIGGAHINGEKDWEGVRKIGTSGIPFLLNWIENKRPRWNVLVEPLKQRWRWIPVFKEEADRGDAAVWTFLALGTNGAPAIPRLGQFAGSTNRTVSTRGITALFFIGPPSIPELVRIMGDTNISRRARFQVAQDLCGLIVKAKDDPEFVKSEPLIAAALIRNLQLHEIKPAEASAVALGLLPRQAHVSGPALVEALRKMPRESMYWDGEAGLSPTIGAVREALIKSLMAIHREGLKEVREELAVALTDPDYRVRVVATNAMRWVTKHEEGR